MRNAHVEYDPTPDRPLLPDRKEPTWISMRARGSSGNWVALEINAHPSRLDLDDVCNKQLKWG